MMLYCIVLVCNVTDCQRILCNVRVVMVDLYVSHINVRREGKWKKLGRGMGRDGRGGKERTIPLPIMLSNVNYYQFKFFVGNLVMAVIKHSKPLLSCILSQMYVWQLQSVCRICTLENCENWTTLWHTDNSLPCTCRLMYYKLQNPEVCSLVKYFTQ